MNDTEFLNRITIAKPCPARWEDMAGDERARFCQHCQKHVYNLSAMTATAATALITEKEGKLCARFYRRRDGTMLTTDCPVGVDIFSRSIRHLATSIAAGVAVLFSVACYKRPPEFKAKPKAAAGKIRFAPIVMGDMAGPMGEIAGPVAGKIAIQPPPPPAPPAKQTKPVEK